MFTGFTPETIDFLWGIRMNNNRDWFMENKPSYVKYLFEPTKALGAAVFQPFIDHPGTLLKVKPILTLKDGELAVLGKALGTKDAMKTLLKLLGDCSDMDPRLPLYLGYTKTDAGCNQFRALLAETIHLDRVEAHSVGAVIGTHVGPGATAVAYIARA